MSTAFIENIYHRIKAWLIIVAIAAPLLLHYAPVPHDWEQKALPVAIACAFGIVVELLVSIQKQLDPRVTYKEYASIAGAIPDIIRLIERTKRTRHNIKILGSTGGTIAAVLLPELLKLQEQNNIAVDLQLAVANPASPLASLLPEHWPDETRLNLARLKKAATEHFNVTCFEYDYIPCLGGALIDGQHLFIGFYLWDRPERNSLKGAEQPHFYFNRGVWSDYPFQLWESWFEHAPQHLLFQTGNRPPSGQVTAS